MIYELKENQFEKIIPLLNTSIINLEISSVALGYNPGWIFVDSIDKPETAMVWSKGIEGVYFTGSASNEAFNSVINDYVERVITPRMIELEMTHLEFSGTSEEWSKTFEEVFKTRSMDRGKQFVYKKSLLNKFNNEISVPKDYKLLDAKELLKSDYKYKDDFLRKNILSWWSDIESFMESGIGYCLAYEDEIICSCVTSFMDDSTMESHIETVEAHQRRGLASVAVRAFILKAQELEYNLYWDCMEKNHGSRALAEKFNYEKAFDYPLYDFKLNQ